MKTTCSVSSSGSRDTIRFYERNGLITSVVGDSETNNYRDYALDNVVRLDFFNKSRDTGMSTADLHDIFDTMAGRCDPDVARSVMHGQFGELKKRAEQIQRAVDFLERIGSAG